VWREEGLRVPARRRQRQRLGTSTCPADRLAAEHPNHVWALDYQVDQTQYGSILKLLNVVDEHTREALTIEVNHRIDAEATVAVLDHLVTSRRAQPQRVGEVMSVLAPQGRQGGSRWRPLHRANCPVP
jgi:putative transposase